MLFHVDLVELRHETLGECSDRVVPNMDGRSGNSGPWCGSFTQSLSNNSREMMDFRIKSFLDLASLQSRKGSEF